ncbi:hypothetical protein JAAARDRAFT_34823 [Jaapia argillacea MUCL 33604]|uniref:Uncharacterized protein n=1 Tax=Jaapia argillacea MUCL 33604 TaxID=933084 RepID=A0A067PTG9_9AGAM|nr:hypothetical protein JAAARDRAFT_34823 [Jaapia argillacea MUCL 33604]
MRARSSWDMVDIYVNVENGAPVLALCIPLNDIQRLSPRPLREVTAIYHICGLWCAGSPISDAKRPRH